MVLSLVQQPCSLQHWLAPRWHNRPSAPQRAARMPRRTPAARGWRLARPTPPIAIAPIGRAATGKSVAGKAATTDMTPSPPATRPAGVAAAAAAAATAIAPASCGAREYDRRPIGGAEYARQNGFVCTPGTWFRGSAGLQPPCQ